MTYVLGLNQITMANAGLVGRKAACLGELTNASLPVAPGFCVTTAAFERCCHQSAAGDRFEVEEIPPDIAVEILRAFTSLGCPAVAVRSSATAEDTPDFSFAGQYESFLQVVGADRLLRAIRDCWASLWSPRAAGYRERAKLAGARPSMAVIVQAMVTARAAGVMFTANPVTSDREEVIITATPGLATFVVSGRASPDTYRLEKANLKVRERYITSKLDMEVAVGDEIRVVPVPARRRSAPALTRRQSSELGRLGVDIEAHFGCPQDVEFAHDGRRFWILQSRPITGLVDWVVPKKRTFYSRHSFIEFLPLPLSPLFETTYLPVMAGFMLRWVREFGVVFRGLQVEPAGPDDTERSGIVTINGYAFFRGRSRILRGDIDVGRSLLRLAVSPAAWLRHFADLWSNRWRRTVLQPYQRTVEKWNGIDRTLTHPATLWDGVVEICRANAEYWRAAAQNRVSGLVELAFIRLYPRLVPAGNRIAVSVLLRGHDSETTRAERELVRLASEARRDDSLRGVFLQAPAEEIERRLQILAGGRRWLSSFRKHVERSGYQIANLDFMAPTLADSPVAMLAAVKHLVADEASGARLEHAREERLAAEAHLKASLDPLRRAVLSRMLALLDYFLVLREDVLFFLGLGWRVARSFILEIGRRMVQSGLLDDDEDVFFLTQAELGEFWTAQGSSADAETLKRAVQVRRERWNAQRLLKPPVLIPGLFRPLGVFRMTRFAPECAVAGGGKWILGMPVSPGRVTAPASVVRSIDEFDRMEAGNVLVAPMTTPAWTPLLAMAGGVVTDVGSLLSHASIVAREYGIPAVIGTGVGSRRIAHGQTVTVDGDTGRVTPGDAADARIHALQPVTPSDPAKLARKRSR